MTKRSIKREIDTEFQATKDIEQAIAELRSIQNHPAMLRIYRVLDKKIDDYTKEILDTDTQGEELNRLRDRRDLTMYFRNLPEILIAIMERPAVPDQPNLDPYSNVDKPPIKA